MTPKEKRLYIQAHNQLFGHVALSQKHMLHIERRPSASPKAKKLAAEIFEKLGQLNKALQTRIDPDEKG